MQPTSPTRLLTKAISQMLHRTAYPATLAVMLGSALLAVGCQSTPESSNGKANNGPAKGKDAQAKQSVNAQSPAKSKQLETAAAQAQAQAKQLNSALNKSKAQAQAGPNRPQGQKPAFASRHPEDHPPRVSWVKPNDSQGPNAQPNQRQANPRAQGHGPANRPGSPAGAAQGPNADAGQAVALGSTSGSTNSTQPTATRAQLIKRLSRRINDGPETPLTHAASAAMLASIEPGRSVPAATLEPLSIDQRETIARFQSVVELLRSQLLSGDSRFNRPVVDQVLDDLFADLPVHIRRAELCRKVSGFGVYEPFDSHTFRAGRSQKMIVYIELSDFKPQKLDSGKFEVRLRQKLALYTESDGQKVWQHKPVRIVDVSRNRRRDFFVVQMVNLPAELGVGKYVLKVDVVDEHGGSVDAKPIPIKLVADESLAQDPKVNKTKLLRRLLSNDEDQRPLGSEPK